MESSILQAIFVATPQAMLFMDNSGSSAWINGNGRLLLRLSANQETLITPLEIAHAMKQLRESAANRAALDQEWQHFMQIPEEPIVNWLWHCGEPYHVVLQVSCVASTFKGIEGRLWVFNDITELHQAHQLVIEQNAHITEQNLEIEQQNITLFEQRYLLEQHNQKLQNINENLDLLHKEKIDLMGIVAHDLKNPLNSILGFAEVLRDANTYGITTLEQAQEAISAIHLAGMSMLTLIKKILESNKAEQSFFSLEMVPINLHHCVEISIISFLSSAVKKNIALHYSYPQDSVIPMIQADATALQQVIDNLLSNAIKFSPHNTEIQIAVQYAPHEQTVRTSSHPALRLAIRDQGPGLTEHDVKHLFGRYTKLSATPTAGEDSTGLGLSIVKRLVDQMHGRIWCESTYGHGATFYVEFLVMDDTQ